MVTTLATRRLGCGASSLLTRALMRSSPDLDTGGVKVRSQAREDEERLSSGVADDRIGSDVARE